MKTLEQRVADLEAQILPKTNATSADDQHLLDDAVVSVASQIWESKQ